MYGYPPSHRRLSDPQPEVCDVCGNLIGGARLKKEPITRGLQGYSVCEWHPWRGKLSFIDRQAMQPGMPQHFVGQGRVFEPGDDTWQFGFQPSNITSLSVSLDASREVTAGTDGVNLMGALDGTSITASQATASAMPGLLLNVQNGFAALKADSTDFLTLSSTVSLTGDFYLLVALRATGAGVKPIIGNAATNNRLFLNSGVVRIAIAASAQDLGTTTLTEGSDYVIEVWRSGTALTTWLNGADDTTGSPTDSGTWDLDQLLADHLSNFFAERFYLMLLASALPDATTRGNIRAWANNRLAIY